MLTYVSKRVPMSGCYPMNVRRESSPLTNEQSKKNILPVTPWRFKLMIDVKTENADAKTLNADEQLSLTSQQTFPAAPFPCKYVHSVVDTLQDAAQAVLALQAAGCDTRDIHLMT